MKPATQVGPLRDESGRVVGPVVQFSLLIVPVIVNAFYFVYAFMGWILEGRDRLNWSIDAANAWWIGVVVILYCAAVAAWTRWRGGELWHPLVVSSIGHGVLAILITLSVFVTLRL